MEDKKTSPNPKKQNQQTPVTPSSDLDAFDRFLSNDRVWNVMSFFSVSFMTANAVVALVRVYTSKNCKISTFVLFAVYLVVMTSLGCFTALDRSPSPWHQDSPKKDRFLVTLWLICTLFNLALAVKFAPVLGSMAPWLIATLVFVVAVLGFYLIFLSDEEPKSSVVSEKQSKNLESSSPLEKV